MLFFKKNRKTTEEIIELVKKRRLDAKNRNDEFISDAQIAERNENHWRDELKKIFGSKSFNKETMRTNSQVVEYSNMVNKFKLIKTEAQRAANEWSYISNELSILSFRLKFLKSKGVLEEFLNENKDIDFEKAINQIFSSNGTDEANKMFKVIADRYESFASNRKDIMEASDLANEIIASSNEMTEEIVSENVEDLYNEIMLSTQEPIDLSTEEEKVEEKPKMQAKAKKD